ncbi:MAG: hypothetical protein ACHQ7N_20365 [Candidatus Methylomirabilales bacterium]
MNVQTFAEPMVRHQELAAAMNVWFADHLRIEIVEDTMQLFHNRGTNADDALVLHFSRGKVSKKTPKE